MARDRWTSVLLACGVVAPPLFVLVFLVLGVADPLNEYPPGTLPVPAMRTRDGILHDLFSAGVFVGIPVACLLAAWSFRRPAERRLGRYSVASALAFGVAFVLTSAGFAQTGRLESIAGLMQRLTVIVGFAWITAVAVRLRRQRSTGASR